MSKLTQAQNTLKDWFNLRSGKATHVALGILTWLGSSQAIGLGLSMAGLPGGGFLIGGLIGSYIGWRNYQAMQFRTNEATPLMTLGRNTGFVASTAFGAAAAGVIFSGGAATLAVAATMAVAAGAVQLLALPKTPLPFSLPKMR